MGVFVVGPVEGFEVGIPVGKLVKPAKVGTEVEGKVLGFKVGKLLGEKVKPATVGVEVMGEGLPHRLHYPSFSCLPGVVFLAQLNLHLPLALLLAIFLEDKYFLTQSWALRGARL